MSVSFTKMHGAGNDFVIFDARAHPLRLRSDQLRRLADRNNDLTGGCDQVIIMEPSQEADVFMRIYNADGGEVDACGNATRCVGWLLMEEAGVEKADVQTNAGILHCAKHSWGAGVESWKGASGLVTADMGAPRFNWQDIPLSQPVDTAHVPLSIEGLSDPVCVSMGNPHVVFLVQDASLLDRIERVGPQLQKHPLFSQGVNVSIAMVSGNAVSGTVQMRVWERGVGLTASCGTAACAVKVAAARRGLLATDKYHTLTLKRDDATQVLMVRWDEAGGHVLLHGPVVLDFRGEWAE